jgi:hypothetical protein
MPSNSQVNSLLYKSLHNTSNINSNIQLDAEPYISRKPLITDQIWLDSQYIPTSGTELQTVINLSDQQIYSVMISGNTFDIVQKYNDVLLESVPGSRNTFYSASLKGCISPEFTITKDYKPIIKINDNSGIPSISIPYNINDIYIDSSAGTITFYTNTDVSFLLNPNNVVDGIYTINSINIQNSAINQINDSNIQYSNINITTQNSINSFTQSPITINNNSVLPTNNPPTYYPPYISFWKYVGRSGDELAINGGITPLTQGGTGTDLYGSSGILYLTQDIDTQVTCNTSLPWLVTMMQGILSDANISIYSKSNDQYSNSLSFYKLRGTDISPEIVQIGDSIGNINFNGAAFIDPSFNIFYYNSASINALVTDSAENYNGTFPSCLSFSVTNNNSLYEVMRLYNNSVNIYSTLSNYVGLTVSESGTQSYNIVLPLTPSTGVLYGDFDNSSTIQTYMGTLPANYGGTGINSYSTGDIIYANSPTTLTTLSGLNPTPGSYSILTYPNFAGPRWSRLDNISSSIKLLGTITSGVWNGSVINVSYGGTGINNYSTGDLIYASLSKTLSKLPIGANEYILSSNGSIPQWVSINTLIGTITTVGTITTGVWHATPIELSYGGTGINLSGNSGLLYLATINDTSVTCNTTLPWLVDFTQGIQNEGNTSIYSYSTSLTSSNSINFYKNHGTIISPGTVLSGDVLGIVNFAGCSYDINPSYTIGAYIKAYASENYSTTLIPTNTGTYLSFYTTNTGTTGAYETLRVISNSIQIFNGSYSSGFTTSGGMSSSYTILLPTSISTGSLYISSYSSNSASLTSGTLPTNYGGTGLTTFDTNRIFYASSTSAISQIASGTSGQLLVSQGVSAPTWTTTTYPLTSTTGDLIYASNTNIFTSLPISTNSYILTVNSNIPSWTNPTSITTIGPINNNNWQGNVISLTYGGTGINLSGNNGLLYLATINDTSFTCNTTLPWLVDFTQGIQNEGNTSIYSYSTSLTSSNSINFYKNHGTIISPGTVLSGDVLGIVNFAGCINTSPLTYNIGAYVHAVATENYVSSGGTPTNGGTHLSFHTTNTGTIGATETLRIVSNSIQIFNGSYSAGFTTSGGMLSSYTILLPTSISTGSLYISSYSSNSASLTSGTLPTNYGGTGLTSFTSNAIFYASSTSVVSQLSNGSTGQLLSSNNTSFAPSWTTTTYPSTSTKGDIIYSSANNVLSMLPIGVANKIMILNSTPLPSWSNYTMPSSITTGDLLYGSGTNAVSSLPIGTSTYILTVNSGPAPYWTNPTTITTIGPINNSTWQGNVIGLTYGGTGINLSGNRGLLYLATINDNSVTCNTTLPWLVDFSQGIQTESNTSIYTYSSTLTTANSISFYKNHGSVISPATVVSGDILGYINFAGCIDISPLTYTIGAYIHAIAIENYKNPAQKAGTQLSFHTTNIGSVGATETLRVVSNSIQIFNGSYSSGFTASGGMSHSYTILLPTTMGRGCLYISNYSSNSAALTYGILPTAYGGTGLNTFTTNAIFYASSTSVMSQLSNGSTGQLLSSNNTSSAPSWTTTVYPSSSTAGDIIYANTNNNFTTLHIGVANKILILNSTPLPSWSNYTMPSTIAAGDLLYGSGTNAVSSLSIGTSTYILTVNSNIPSWTNPTSITTIGPINNNTWQGNVIGLTYGGTGINLSGNNGLLYLATINDTSVTCNTTLPWLVDFTQGIQTEGNTSIYSYSTNLSSSNVISFYKNHGSVITPGTILSGENLGVINFAGCSYVTTPSYTIGAYIKATASENYSTTLIPTNTGTYLSIFTTNTGTTGASETLRVSSNGIQIFNGTYSAGFTTSGGITSSYTILLPTSISTGSLYISSYSSNSASLTSGTLPTNYGGTGLTAFFANRIFYASSTSAISQIASGTSGQLLVSQGVSAPTWTTTLYPSSSTAGDILYANTNNNFTTLPIGVANKIMILNSTPLPSWSNYTMPSTIAAGDLLYGSGTNAVSSLPLGSNNNYILTTNTGLSKPNWTNPTSITTIGPISNSTWQGNTIGTAYGGTNLTTFSTNCIFYASSTSVMSQITSGTSGQLLVSQGSGSAPLWTNPASITTIGPIVNSTWQGTAVAIDYGGTGGSLKYSSGLLYLNNSSSTTVSCSKILPWLVDFSLGLQTESNITIYTYSTDNATNNKLTFNKYHSVYPAQSGVNSGDVIGSVTYGGFSGATTFNAVILSATATDTYYSTTHCGTYFSIFTTASGTSTQNETIRAQGTNIKMFNGSTYYRGFSVPSISNSYSFILPSTAASVGTLYIGSYSSGDPQLSLGTLPVNCGGTGLTSFTANRIFYASSTSVMTQMTSGTSGQLLVSQGSASIPTWTTTTYPTSSTLGDIIIANGTNTFSRLPIAASNYMLIGGTSPSWTTNGYLSTISLGTAGSVTGSLLYLSHSGFTTGEYYCNIIGTLTGGSSNNASKRIVNISTTISTPNATIGSPITGVNGHIFYVTPNLILGNYTTMDNYYGFYLLSGNSSFGTSSTLTNSYGMYINTPSFGTNKYCAYFQGVVGINNTTPVTYLDIVGQVRASTTGALNGYNSQIIAQSSTASTESSITFTNSTVASSNNWSIGTNISDNGLSIYSWSGSGRTLCIGQTGVVGIGIGGFNTQTQLYLGNNSNCSYMMQIGGVLANGQVALSTPGLYLRPSSTSYNLIAFQFAPLISPSAAGTYVLGYSVRADGFLDTKGYGTITTWANFYCDGGGTTTSSLTGPGTVVTNAYSLYINAPTFGTNKYCAYFNGSCGFGTTSPTALVDITGTVSASNCLMKISGTVNIDLDTQTSGYGSLFNPTFNLTGTGTSVGILGVRILPQYNIGSGITVTNAYSLIIQSSSLVGSGTLTKSYGLYVNSPINGTTNICANFTGIIGVNTVNPNTTYGIDVGGLNCRQASSTLWTSASDMRIKENIINADLDICYNNVKNITLNRFAWKQEYMPNVNDRNCLGWIAQNVELFFPKAVYQSKENGLDDFRCLDADQIYKCMYGALQKVIIDKEILENTVNIQQQQLNDQNSRITNQQQQIETLQQQVQLLLSKI